LWRTKGPNCKRIRSPRCRHRRTTIYIYKHIILCIDTRKSHLSLYRRRRRRSSLVLSETVYIYIYIRIKYIYTPRCVRVYTIIYTYIYIYRSVESRHVFCTRPRKYSRRDCVRDVWSQCED